MRTYKDGQAKLNAYLEDYAFFIDGLLTLFETTGELTWLEESSALTETMIREFWDEQDGGFFYTGRSHETLIVRSKDFFDNATPSGNSVAAEVLLRIGLLTDNADYQRLAATILRLTGAAVGRYPSGFGRMLCALDFHLGKPKEIGVIGATESHDTQSLLKELWRVYLPNKVIAVSAPGDIAAAQLTPLLRDRPQLQGHATAYLCENFTCKQPVNTASEFAAQLQNRTATTT